MKRALTAVALLCGASQAYALPCAPDTLAAYAAPTFSCEIGSNTFSDFTTLPVSAAATEIAASAITVVPIPVGPSGFGLDFLINGAASSATLLEFLVGYRVHGSSISGARVQIDGASATDDGVVTAIKDICLEGVFSDFTGVGPASCTGVLSAPLIAFQIAIDGLSFEERSFSPIASIAVVDDIAIDAGLQGSASLAMAGNRFVGAAAPVPVPGTAALLALGVLCFGVTSVRNRRVRMA